MTKTLPAWIRDALWAGAGAVMFVLVFLTAHTFWYLPAGVRFASFLLLPLRSWPWFLAVQYLLFAGFAPTAFIGERLVGLPTYGLILFAASCTGPGLLRSMRWSLWPLGLKPMVQLVVVMASSAALTMLVNLFAYAFAEAARMSLLRLCLQLLLGDYIGMLIIVPLAVMLVQARPELALLRRWRFDVPIVLLPMLLVYALIGTNATESQVFFFAALLAFVPSLYFAVRSGWRGAAISLSATSLIIAFGEFASGDVDLTVEAQGILAVAGSAALLLGAARDALVGSQQELQERHAHLVAAKAAQDRLAVELREAARRNLDTAEDVRRWITSELHDEIGQNLTALQTRVRLLERKGDKQDSGELTAEIDLILARMRQTVSGLMSSLRPAGLDDFGLTQALREGAIRNLVESNRLVCDLRIDDAGNCLDRLDGGAQTTLYRIVQEAATNTIRHAEATRLWVCLRARGDVDSTHVLLVIADDGRGFDVERRGAGIGLVGIHDRVLALGGRMRVRSDGKGTRVWVQANIHDAVGAT